MTNNLPGISVRDFTKRFGSFTAVDRISFDVGKGEIFGFLGANGAGKTTAMRMLCGLSRPTSGSGTVADFDITTAPESIKRRIGYMSQRFSLYEELTVTENLRLFATIFRMDNCSIKNRTEKIFGILDMHPIRDTIVRDIPVGWKQKLAFAASTIHNHGIALIAALRFLLASSTYRKRS